MMDLSFGREHRLRGRKLIAWLFRNGASFKAYPIIGIVAQYEENAPTSFGFSVAKKRIGSAVERNQVKRRMREAVRLSMAEGLIDRTSGLALMLIYVDKQVVDYEVIERATRKLLRKIAESR